MHKQLTVAAVALLAALLLAPAANAQTTISPNMGAWCWFADPRAVDYQGGPVFGWVDGLGNIMVGNHRGQRFVLDPQLQRDDHNNPAFYIRQDGRLTAFWSSHNGPQLKYRTTTGTSITDWGPTRTMPANPVGGKDTGYAYPNPMRVRDTLYMFWSGTGATATYATSQDDGETWSEARSLFTGLNARYVKYRAVGREIHVAWTLVHPRVWKSGIYHMIIRDGKLWRQDGTQIGELGTPVDSTAGDLVYDPAPGHAWIHDIAIKDGKPIIAYATFPTDDAHTYRVARYNGGWMDEHVVDAGPSFNPHRKEMHYSGGITINPRNPAVVYLSRKVAGQFEIERWTRDAAGWAGVPITRNSTTKNVRPFRVGGGLAWMRGEYPNYWGYKTDIQWLAPGESVRTPDDAEPTAPPPGTPAATLPPAPTPTPAAAPTPAWATPVVRSDRKRSCRRHRQAWRKTHSRRAARRYRRCRARIQGRQYPANRAAGEGAIKLTTSP